MQHDQEPCENMDGSFPNDPPRITEFTEHILLKLSGFMPGHSPSSGPEKPLSQVPFQCMLRAKMSDTFRYPFIFAGVQFNFGLQRYII